MRPRQIWRWLAPALVAATLVACSASGEAPTAGRDATTTTGPSTTGTGPGAGPDGSEAEPADHDAVDVADPVFDG
ncbi:MAG TPA: hypothetical protein VHK88_06540, partial [Aquihabitans sp.]|nr:hypothetical protein [Aquihabitans sp.]